MSDNIVDGAEPDDDESVNNGNVTDSVGNNDASDKVDGVDSFENPKTVGSFNTVVKNESPFTFTTRRIFVTTTSLRTRE